MEIDETLVVKRKHNTGRILKEIWLFVGIERVSKKRFIVPLQDKNDKAVPRNRETLFPIIEKYIRPGSIIVSDCWKAYHTLHAHNYEHWKINHSLNFIDPNDPEVHTQNIERFWRHQRVYQEDWNSLPSIWPNISVSIYLLRTLLNYVSTTLCKQLPVSTLTLQNKVKKG